MWAQSFLGLLADPGDDQDYSSIDDAGAADIDRAPTGGGEWGTVEEGLRNLTVCRVAALVPLGLLIAAYNLLGAALWVWSVTTLAHDRERPCDQPLKGWLCVTVFWVALDKLYCSYRYNEALDMVQNIDQNVLPALCSGFIRLLLMGVGLWWYSCSETCARLSPSIHTCVRCYLVFHAAFAVHKAIVGCSLGHLVLLARSGRFPFARPCASRPARAGLVDELATVEPAGDPLVEGGECAVCLGGFDGGGELKRTPCSPVPHHFHRECLRTWLERYGRTCPTCRTDLEKAVDGFRCGADLENTAGGTPSGGDREEVITV